MGCPNDSGEPLAAANLAGEDAPAVVGESTPAGAAAVVFQLLDHTLRVEQYFDFAEKMVANQREFAQQWASATVKASEAVTEQTQRAIQSIAAHTANGSNAVDNATDAAHNTANN